MEAMYRPSHIFRQFNQLFFSVLFALAMLPCAAQDDYVITDTSFAQLYQGQQAVFVEAGGNGIIWSLNYDRILVSKEYWKLSGRVGAQYTPWLDSLSVVGVPVELVYLSGDYRHFMEFGAGAALFHSDRQIPEGAPIPNTFINASMRLGYRYQRPEGGFFWRVGFVPMYPVAVIQRDPEEGYNRPIFMVGLGLGASF